MADQTARIRARQERERDFATLRLIGILGCTWEQAAEIVRRADRQVYAPVWDRRS